MRPEDAQYEVSGSFYKVGAHGFVYLWVDGEWRHSTKKEWELTHPVYITGAIKAKV